MSDVFNDFSNNRYLSLTLSVPVWDWGKNSLEVEMAQIDLKGNQLKLENLKESVKKDVIAKIYKLKSLEERINVLSKSVELAEKSYDISLERFKTGNITSFELTQAQLRLTNSKLNRVNTLIDYKIAIAEIERLN